MMTGACRVPAAHSDKIARILARLNEALIGQGMGPCQGYRLHPLKCELVGFWPVSVLEN